MQIFKKKSQFRFLSVILTETVMMTLMVILMVTVMILKMKGPFVAHFLASLRSLPKASLFRSLLTLARLPAAMT